MDYFPSVFSQKELYWLDNLMPASNKEKKNKEKKKKIHENSGTDLVSTHLIKICISFSFNSISF